MKDLYAKIQNAMGKRELKQQQIKTLTTELETLEVLLDNTLKAQLLHHKASEATQKEVKRVLDPLVTKMMQAVFGGDYSFYIDVTPRRGKVGYDLYFKKGEDVFVPKKDNGFGLINIAAVALEVTAWRLQNPCTDPVFILDEPLRDLSQEYLSAAIQMFNELAKELKLQFIFTTHKIEDVAYSADKVFKVTQNSQLINGVYRDVSKIKEIKVELNTEEE